MKLSIIIPVHNEMATLPTLLNLIAFADLPAGIEREVIVVDDGSTDGTHTFVLSQRIRGFRCIKHAERSGKGTAIRTGLDFATGDIILIQDGDLEYSPSDYAALIRPILAGHASVVYGSRFLGQKITGMAWKNRLANRILTAAANLLYGCRITDEATGYKAFRADTLRGMKLKSEGFEFCPEVTAKAARMGFRIHEVPINYAGRTVGQGKKIKARDGFKALWTLVRWRFGKF